MKEKNGEHPLGDAGQLILFGLFLVIWILDSFILHHSTFLANSIPLVIRLIILGAALAAAFYLFKSGHVVVSGEQRPTTSLFCLILLVAIVVFYNYIANFEEKLLEVKFGEAYVAYQKNTGKWVPHLGKKG